MKNKQKQHFFDQLDTRPAHKVRDDDELVRLMGELEDVQVPDPGEAYWANFNARIQQKLDRRPVRRPFWMTWLLPLSAVAAALVLAVWLQPSVNVPSTSTVDTETSVLSALSAEELDLLAGVYAADDTSFDDVFSENDAYDLIYDSYQSDFLDGAATAPELEDETWQAFKDAWTEG